MLQDFPQSLVIEKKNLKNINLKLVVDRGELRADTFIRTQFGNAIM